MIRQGLLVLLLFFSMPLIPGSENFSVAKKTPKTLAYKLKIAARKFFSSEVSLYLSTWLVAPPTLLTYVAWVESKRNNTPLLKDKLFIRASAVMGSMLAVHCVSWGFLIRKLSMGRSAIKNHENAKAINIIEGNFAIWYPFFMRIALEHNNKVVLQWILENSSGEPMITPFKSVVLVSALIRDQFDMADLLLDYDVDPLLPVQIFAEKTLRNALSYGSKNEKIKRKMLEVADRLNAQRAEKKDAQDTYVKYRKKYKEAAL